MNSSEEKSSQFNTLAPPYRELINGVGRRCVAAQIFLHLSPAVTVLSKRRYERNPVP